MADMSDPSQRFITPEKGVVLFSMQMHIFPNLAEEVAELSGGSIGVTNAILFRMGDAISEDPVQETTVARLREVLGVPEGVEDLADWRRGFWYTFKEEREARFVLDQE